MPEAAAWFRQTEMHYCSILEWFILQNVRVNAQSGSSAITGAQSQLYLEC